MSTADKLIAQYLKSFSIATSIGNSDIPHLQEYSDSILDDLPNPICEALIISFMKRNGFEFKGLEAHTNGDARDSVYFFERSQKNKGI